MSSIKSKSQKKKKQQYFRARVNIDLKQGKNGLNVK